MPNPELTAEIGALQRELNSTTTTKADPASSKSETDSTISHLLEKLTEAFEDTSAETERFLTDHPLAVIVAAFTLGVFVGRLSGAK